MKFSRRSLWRPCFFRSGLEVTFLCGRSGTDMKLYPHSSSCRYLCDLSVDTNFIFTVPISVILFITLSYFNRDSSVTYVVRGSLYSCHPYLEVQSSTFTVSGNPECKSSDTASLDVYKDWKIF